MSNFHSLFGTLGLKEDIWSVGPFAKVNKNQTLNFLYVIEIRYNSVFGAINSDDNISNESVSSLYVLFLRR